ncbi:hypothetical protein TTHERM_00138160 (macronuclear) [Tetrahymena thermophila SB210]|uniref:Rab-GTPase-TBC domain protein n=1 Tax=Tetrahymena thermophila (strain SB210) TaxID=312017 RepID=I7LVR1_TETTS|nr:hypothetical protein TTHERM_00138160 [Tetrahymena thermophila SB210]EAR99553.2 hypothetical protein TTHERM_00138160 [Tetrahymena thermophila SB210]|eukprot:XP_001019798.2 hypothetical protein TTHERM_00138160 [Tetrahymena thermophila SB210]
MNKNNYQSQRSSYSYAQNNIGINNKNMYLVGNQFIKDKWLEDSQSDIDYHFFTNKAFDLLDAQARLQEIDKEDVTKINQTIKEIEYINRNDDTQEEDIKQENLLHQIQEEVFDESKNVTFYKKSKILGKPLVRFANITKQFIRIIYHSKKNKQITHDQYIYQVEKRTQDSVIQVKTSKSVQNQIKYKNEIVKFFQGTQNNQGNEGELSSLKWLEMQEYNYRIILKNIPGALHKFEYALYLCNEKEVKQALNTIRISQAVHQLQVLPLNCQGDINFLFQRITHKWKACVATLLKKQMDSLNSINKQNFKSITQQNFTANTSYSQDYYNNRNSKPLQYRNNYSMNENQMSNIIRELQGTKDNRNNFIEQDSERIARELVGSSIIQNNSEIQQKQSKIILKKGSTTEEFDSNIFSMTPIQKDTLGKSEEFDNFLKQSVKYNTKTVPNDGNNTIFQSQQTKIKQNQDLEGLPQPIVKQNDNNLISDESINLDILDQKKANVEEIKDIYISQSNEEKPFQNKSSYYNPSIINNILNPNNTKSLAFFLNDNSQSNKQNSTDNNSQQQKIQTNQSKLNESNKNISSSGIQSAESQNYYYNEQLKITQSITTSQYQNTGRSDLQAPQNSIAFSSLQTSQVIDNNSNPQQSQSQTSEKSKEKSLKDQKENETQKFQQLDNSHEDIKNQSPSIMGQLLSNNVQPITLDPLLEEPEITSIGSITPQNSYQKLQNTTLNQTQKNSSKNNYNSLQSQKGKEFYQTQFLQENMLKSVGEQNSKQNSESQRSKQNSVQIFDYLNQQKPSSQRSLSVSSTTGSKPLQQNKPQDNSIQINKSNQGAKYENNQLVKNEILEGENNKNDSFIRYQMEQKYQKESAILQSYKKKSLKGEDSDKASIKEISKLQDNYELKSSERQFETRKQENQAEVSDRSSIQEQQKKKEQMLEYINMNRESIVQSQQETQFNTNNFDNNISVFLQKLELISPITDYPPEIQVEMYLFNVNNKQIVVQSEWKQFNKPIEKIEDNFIYEVEESYKEVVFQISKTENYEVHLFIKTKFNSKVIGTIATKLSDVIDYDNPGKDFWLICPINYPNIPLAIINIWSSIHENCDNYRENIYQLYSQINTIKNPLYKSYTHFPEIRIEDLTRIEQLIFKMGYKQNWLLDDIFEEQSQKILNGSKLKEIKRQVQYGMVNRIGYFSANIFIQENLYNRLLTKLNEKSIPKKEVLSHFHQLCLEGIPHNKRQELYLEMLDFKEKIEQVRDDFISYCSCNPASQNSTIYNTSAQDIYVSYELNQSGNEVKTLLNDFNLTKQRDNFYQILYSEAKYYQIIFDLDFEFQFNQDQQMAQRILRTLSFVMVIQSASISPQFYSVYHQLLNKCIILNNSNKNTQESESFWLLYTIITSFNSNRQLITRYFHLIESSTSFQKISNIIGIDCLIGLFSGSFNEELCFRCWDVLFMEYKRKSWDIQGYLSCIGISLVNQYQIGSQKEWEIFGKYYFNFTEMFRLAKSTYETLLSDQSNYKKWIEKLTQSEQSRKQIVEKYENQRVVVSKYVHNYNITFNFIELEKLINELMENNYYQSKYQIQNQKPRMKEYSQYENLSPRQQSKTERDYSTQHVSPKTIFSNQKASPYQNSQSPQVQINKIQMMPSNRKQQSQPQQQQQQNFMTLQASNDNLINIRDSVNQLETPKINQLSSNRGAYNSNLIEYSLKFRNQEQSNYQFTNVFTPQKSNQNSIRQFSPVQNNIQNNLAAKKTINPFGSSVNSAALQKSPQTQNLVSQSSSSGEKQKEQYNLRQSQDFSEQDYFVNGLKKSYEESLESIRLSSFQNQDEEYLFKKENLHIFISKIVCVDLDQLQSGEQTFTNSKLCGNYQDSNFQPDFIDGKRVFNNGIKKLKSIYFPSRQENSLKLNYLLEIGRRQVQGDDIEKIDQYQFFESVEKTPMLRIKVRINDLNYSLDIDIRAFNKNTMYHQMSFMIESQYPDQIILEYNIYIESFSLLENQSMQPVLQQQMIQQYTSVKQKMNQNNNNSNHNQLQDQALKGIYDVQLLKNDVCLNNSFTNSRIERFSDFENYFNNQVLLQSNIQHFIYSKNILTRNHRVFNLASTSDDNKVMPNSTLIKKLLSLTDQTRITSLQSLIKDLQENDAIEILQFILFYVPASYQQKLKILYQLFLLRYPQQTSDDLEAYLIDFFLKTEMNFLQFRDIQQLILSLNQQNDKITFAKIMFNSGETYDVTDFFINKIVSKLCNTYLMDNLNISQPFIIEKIIQSIKTYESSSLNNFTSQQSTQQQQLLQRPVKNVIDYNLNFNSHQQNNLDLKSQTPFDPIFAQSQNPNSGQRKNFFLDQEIDGQTHQFKQKEGKFEVFFKQQGRLVKKDVEFTLDEFSKVTITSNYENTFKLKEIFSKNQFIIRNKAIQFPLSQFRNWINLKQYQYIGDFDTFKQYVCGIKLLEVYLMKDSQFVHPSLPIQINIPILLQIQYHDNKQLYCDYIFISSNIHNLLKKSVSINYLPHLTLDDSIIFILSRILKQPNHFVKKYVQVLINSKIIDKLNVPLKEIVSPQKVVENNNIIQIFIQDKKPKINVPQKYQSPQNFDFQSQNSQIPDPQYQFNGYSIWNICSTKQYLPCKIVQPNLVKYNKQKFYYDNNQNVIRWY